MIESSDDDILTLAEQFGRFGESLSPQERRLLSEVLRRSVTEIVGDTEPAGGKDFGALLVALHARLRELSLSRMAREAGGQDGV